MVGKSIKTKLRSAARNILVPLRHDLESRVARLRYIFFEITTSCNLNCLHCGSECSKDKSGCYLPADKIISVLQEIKDSYVAENIMVAITGGEPFCYPDLYSLGRKVADLGFIWGMVTNGYGWDKESVEKLEKSGIKTVTVSLDGLEEEHNWLRGREKSFKHSLQTIKLIQQSSFFAGLDVFTCVHKRNLHQLDDVFKLLQILKVKRWRLSLIDPIGSAVEIRELFLSPEEFRLMLDKIVSYRKENVMDVNFADSGYLGIEFENKARTLNYFCNAGINVAGIRVNGDIAACPNIDPEIKEGNIYQDSFVNVWENKYSRFRNRKWMKIGICADCSEWNLCRGNSFHLWDFGENKTRFCHKKRIEGGVK